MSGVLKTFCPFADAPSFTCNQHYEIKEDAQVQSVCEPEGVPSPVTTWTKDGVILTTPRRWTKHDSGNYSLRATNSHGTDSHVLYLDVQCMLSRYGYKNRLCVFFPHQTSYSQTPPFLTWKITLRRFTQERTFPWSALLKVTLPLRSTGNTPLQSMRLPPLGGARRTSRSQEPRLPTPVFTSALPRAKPGV